MSGGRIAELQGTHVLVIDDDQLGRHFLRSVLEFSGAIVTAARAADAMRAALIADVIVCDLASAEMAGREFLSQLQHLYVRLGRTVPAIALVPAGTTSPRVRAAGFQSYLTKPIDGDELQTAVVERLASRGHVLVLVAQEASTCSMSPAFARKPMRRSGVARCRPDRLTAHSAALEAEQPAQSVANR
jgi:CheY-like chemotaxis protein